MIAGARISDSTFLAAESTVVTDFFSRNLAGEYSNDERVNMARSRLAFLQLTMAALICTNDTPEDSPGRPMQSTRHAMSLPFLSNNCWMDVSFLLG